MRGALALMALLAAVGCGRRDIILPGEREALRTAPEAGVGAQPISLPGVTTNADWTHRAGGPDHRLSHPALPGALTLAFAVDVGEGNSRRARITSDPVVAGGRIFTLDARATVSAVAPSGAILWQTDLDAGSDRREDGSGGGIATDGAAVYVTNGYGRLVRLDAATGGVVWSQDLDAPGAAAPTVVGDLVYVAGRDSTGWAVETGNGRVRWQISGVPGGAVLGGGAGVAVSDGLAIFPFPSGEVTAAFAEGGLQRWSTVIAGGRPGDAASIAATDIGADPVVAGETVYVGNTSGRLVALNLASGERLWTATEGALGPVVVEGGSVFLVNDREELLRLNASDGSVIWRVVLPRFASDRPRRQDSRFVHYGPVLAGGRLIVASTDGVLRQFDPASGAALGDVALPGGAASLPAVAGGTLYVLNRDGQLLAFR
jgi:outer membrane protein assembly factor BamB